MPAKEDQKALLSTAIGCVINGDIYGLKKAVKKGFDLSAENHLCINDAARLGHTHIVSYILEEMRPPENIIKKLSAVCVDNFKHATLTAIIKSTGVYSKRAKDSAQYAGNSMSLDYLMDREIYTEVGSFYKHYKNVPQRIKKLLSSNQRKYRDGEPEKIAFENANQEVIRILRGVVFKNELSTMLQICCREKLKDAADVFLLATRLQREMGLGFQGNPMLKDEGRNSELTYVASFGNFTDYLNLKKENLFLGAYQQKNNLGYTISLAIKNGNYEIAEDLIQEGYCPDPQITENTTSEAPPAIINKDDMFCLVMRSLINARDQKQSNKLLTKILERTHSKKDKSIKDCLTLDCLEKQTWDHTLTAIKIGNEEIAKTLIKCMGLKNIVNKNYYGTIRENYVIEWLLEQQKLEMIKEKSSNSPTLEL